MKRMLLKLPFIFLHLTWRKNSYEKNETGENTLPVCEECVMTSHWFALSPIVQFQRCIKSAW